MTFAPFHVDVAKIGGSLARQRHAFTLPAPAPAPAPAGENLPRFIPPPPKRGFDLGQGRPGTPSLTEGQIEAVRSKAKTAAEALQLELEVVKTEADWVSVQTLRSAPDKYRAIPIVGEFFSPREIRTQVTIDARAIQAAAQRILGGAAAPYLLPETMDVLATVVEDAKKLVAYVEQFDLEPITAVHQKLSDDHVQSHVKGSRDLIESAERDVVSAEAGSVPVTEPGESGDLGTFLAVAALAAVTLVLFDIL